MLESEKINALFEESKAYIENRINLLKLEISEDFSDGTSELISYTIIGIIGAILFFLISILAGISISIWLDNYLLGFGIVVSIYLLLFLFFLIFRKSILKLPLQNRIIRYIFKNNG
tara:strand:- start:195 stop:542 length:348 start_codon:yes stop_codon:yes gene_type:complete